MDFPETGAAVSLALQGRDNGPMPEAREFYSYLSLPDALNGLW
jgi:hypothetical protein